MKFEELSKLLIEELKPKLENHKGLSIFARERAKFEGWLKVELCDSLSKYFTDVCPEKDRTDIAFDDWAIELKTVNTNVRYDGVKNKNRPITKNTQGVVDDIEKLRRTGFTHKAVLFVTFPITPDNEYWQTQLKRIRSKLSAMNHVEFDFKDKIPGVLYLGLIS